MAGRAQPLGGAELAGAGALLVVLAASVLPLGALGFHAGEASGLRAADWAAISFTVVQAALSALLSVALAIPVARALARRSFPGRGALVTLMGAPFILPVIVAVLGLLQVFGREGLLNTALSALGLPTFSIFGLTGVVLAHVFLNMPLAVRLLLLGWQAVPAERLRLAASLGFSARDMERNFHWPLLREVVPGALLIIFVICTTSFAVALTLGGGPRATTVELAIYQAFRFDFDLGRAAALGLVQVALTGLAGLLAVRLARLRRLGPGLDRPLGAWPGDSGSACVLDACALVGAAGFLLLPLLLLLIDGAGAVLTLPAQVYEAAARSVVLALASAIVASALALAIAALTLRPGAGDVAEMLSLLGVAVSPLVVGTGLFLLLRPVTDPVALALPVTGLVNAIFALPFILRGLVPALQEAARTQGRLAVSLGLTGPRLWRFAYLPRLRRPLGFGAGLAAALSMGDLGVIALFSAPGQETLPLQMYRLMGAYRTDDALGAAILLTALSLGLFMALDGWGRRWRR